MAQKGAVKGMNIDLSSSPAKCNACILGKQIQTPVASGTRDPQSLLQIRDFSIM